MLQVMVFLVVILISFLLYAVIPNWYARNRTKLVKKEIFHQQGEKVIALTFDDGPDKRYTGQILDILSEYHVKATFFIVAKNAEKCPELIERMKMEGHTIAMHANKHKSAWMSFPWETKREFEESLRVFKNFGLQMRFFRPPWGTFNAVSLKYALRNKLVVVLWTVEAFDWRKKNTPENIGNIILRRIENLGIIVLHDSGGAEGAPLHTILALKNLIPQLLDQGYKLVTLNEGMKEHDNH